MNVAHGVDGATEVAAMMYQGIRFQANKSLSDQCRGSGNLDDICFLTWTELQSIDTLAIGVGRGIFVFDVGHASGDVQTPRNIRLLY